MAFGLNAYPVVYRSKYTGSAWTEEFLEKEALSAAEEAALSGVERERVYEKRNLYADMPLVGYSSQYALSVFEGVKALPQKDGGKDGKPRLAIFRPEENARRFYNSLSGLYMPGFPTDTFVKALVETVSRNAALGYYPSYDEAWEKDHYSSAESIYIRPFSYTEGGIGVNISKHPWVMVVLTPVGAYFGGGNSDAVVSRRIRATPNGTGWIKVASNYVTSALAKHEAIEEGYMECVFLDAEYHRYLEEGSSSNFFVVLKSGDLVTPELGDTILPGITRKSIIELAQDLGVRVCERKLSIEEVMDQGKECFVSGTAAGATPISSLTYNGRKTVFGPPGELTMELQKTLKGIQYGLLPDKKGWLTPIL
jgi:branched-chain amino acid aminotransferase